MSQATNNVGVVRLLLATLVIVSHSYPFLYGDNQLEPLFVLTKAVSLGSLAVAFFFLLSGFLITGSLLASRSRVLFMARRVLRIYPAYIVAFLASLYILAPATGGTPTTDWGQVGLGLLTLEVPPEAPGELSGVTYVPFLNGSMWTISFEFRCYILTLAFGLAGLLRQRRAMLTVTVAVLALAVLTTFAATRWRIEQAGFLPGLALLTKYRTSDFLTFFSFYMVGSCARLYWADILPRLTARAALWGLLGTALLLCNVHSAAAGLATFGAVGLFWLAFRAPLGWFGTLNRDWDISYGVYLYGWPVASYLRWLIPDLVPWQLTALTLPLAYACGAISWLGLERWMRVPARWSRARRATA